MNSADDEQESNPLRQLTVDQRHQVYEEEKRQREEKAPVFSKTAKVLLIVYIFGCVLLYFGIAESLMEFCRTREWRYRPEPGIFDSLFGAAIALCRPFLAVVISVWAGIFALMGTWFYGVPIGIVLLLAFIYYETLWRLIKKVFRYDRS